MLRILLLGELSVEVDGRRLDPIASRRARSLLAWLAYHPGMHPRSRVAGVFWPEVLDSSGRASLVDDAGDASQGAGRGRRSLPDRGARAGRHRRRREIFVDVREVGRLAATDRLEEALSAVPRRASLDLDDDWVLDARRAQRERVGGLLERLGEEAEAAGDLEAAAAHARRRLELDPLSEDAARVLMRRLAAGGDRAAAVATYESLRAVLQRELGMAPSSDTRALAEQLRAAPQALDSGVRTLPLPAALRRAGTRRSSAGRGNSPNCTRRGAGRAPGRRRS